MSMNVFSCALYPILPEEFAWELVSWLSHSVQEKICWLLKFVPMGTDPACSEMSILCYAPNSEYMLMSKNSEKGLRLVLPNQKLIVFWKDEFWFQGDRDAYQYIHPIQYYVREGHDAVLEYLLKNGFSQRAFTGSNMRMNYRQMLDT